MRYTVTKQQIQVVGYIWQPGVGLCAYEKSLDTSDMENIGDVRDREAVAQWIDKNFGDFQSIEDFRADFHLGDENVIHEWGREESEMAYNDCMFPAEE